MRNRTVTLALGLLVAFLLGCDSVEDVGTAPPRDINGDWLIPSTEVLDGGPGVDGIPSIDNPNFAPAHEIAYVPGDRRVIGVRIGNVIRAYPHQILDHHEIVNDRVGNNAFALTFCPLTGTGICWDRSVAGRRTEFGVSGMIFRNNMIPFDRNTRSYWSQMQLRAVRGELAGTIIETKQVVETTWDTWLEMYAGSEVLTTDTGFNRNYGGFLYGADYRTNDNNLLFPIRNEDPRLPRKELVHGVIADTPAEESAEARVYVVDDFGPGVKLIRDTIAGREFIIVGSAERNIVAAFELDTPDMAALEFEPLQDRLPFIMKDNEGNRWDVFGVAEDGPRLGERLTHAPSYSGYWFAFADFFPGIDIYGRQE